LSGVTGRQVSIWWHIPWLISIPSQFIVEEREKHASNDLFWAKFSDGESGTQFGFQQILTSLKHERAEHDALDAADALKYFDGDLSHNSANGAFSYTSKTGTVVMTKCGDIAKNWCSLLARDQCIAMSWSGQQAGGLWLSTEMSSI
jgi:hypothetical protein